MGVRLVQHRMLLRSWLERPSGDSYPPESWLLMTIMWYVSVFFKFISFCLIINHTQSLGNFIHTLKVNLLHEELVLFVCATTGQGDPPDNMKVCPCQFLERKRWHDPQSIWMKHILYWDGTLLDITSGDYQTN